MSKDDHIEYEGKVLDTMGGGFYKINLESGSEVLLKLAGKMRLNKIQVMPGDRVRVALSKYDMKSGIITFRYK